MTFCIGTFYYKKGSPWIFFSNISLLHFWQNFPQNKISQFKNMYGIKRSVANRYINPCVVVCCKIFPIKWWNRYNIGRWLSHFVCSTSLVKHTHKLSFLAYIFWKRDLNSFVHKKEPSSIVDKGSPLENFHTFWLHPVHVIFFVVNNWKNTHQIYLKLRYIN